MPTPKLGSFNYTIQPGDTLFDIAKKFNTTVAIIRKFNIIHNPDLIYVGQQLLIAESPPEAIIYTVRPGDTLSAVARKYGTSLKNLVDFNYLDNPNLIFPGQQLVVTASLRGLGA